MNDNDLKSMFMNTETSVANMLSVILENQATNKAMLQVIIPELANGSEEKEDELIELVNRLKDEELQRVVSDLIDRR